MTSSIELWALPYPSTEIDDGPNIASAIGLLTLSFSSEEGGQCKICFDGVFAYRFTEFGACTTVDLDSYDALHELKKSRWLKLLRKTSRDIDRNLKHYKIFLDDIGCYDIVAMHFTVVQ